MTIQGRDRIEASLAYITGAFGSSEVVIGSATLRGLLADQETYGTDASGDFITNRTRVLTVARGALPGPGTLPAHDSTLTVDGITYRVRRALVSADGREVAITVAAAQTDVDGNGVQL